MNRNMNNSSLISERVRLLREYMSRNGLSAFVFPSTDPHCGEYVPEHWKTRQWISGFDGSAGTAVVTLREAALWTDSRYFLAATEQLDGTPFCLMKDGLPETPGIATWIETHLHPHDMVGIDGWVNTVSEVEALATVLRKADIDIEVNLDPMDELWKDRPSIPQYPVERQPLVWAGERVSQKLSRLRQQMTEQKVDATIISQLDEIAWLTNLRGTDVHCNPVFVSYLFVTSQEATLFVHPNKITDEIIRYLQEEGIQTQPYENITTSLEKYAEGRLVLDPTTSNWQLVTHLPATCLVTHHPSFVAPMKAIKNEAEIQGFRHAMRRDGVAMVRFLKWLIPAVRNGKETELTISQRLEELRAEQDHYRGLSFDTIAGYAEHGAIVHYEATQETASNLAPRGLLLLDSGAQYQDGTTDITRTIALGPTTEQERLDYTLVLKGHIRLALTKFPEGTCGTQLDAMARYAMWQRGINFLHGTGHGVGAYLNVHEGPHQIRMNWKPAPLLAGMTVTNEPGIYRAGKHGVRLENTMLITPYMQTKYGKFLQLEPLTLCPFDTRPILWEMMDEEEINYLNTYHQRVYEELAPLLNQEENLWLREETRPVIR